MTEESAPKGRSTKGPTPQKRSKTKSKPKRGRPRHEPTAKNRLLIVRRVATGVTQFHIAKELGVTVPTLARHYSAELKYGAVQFRQQIVDALYDQMGRGKTAAAKALMALTVKSTPEASDAKQQASTAAPPPVTKLGKKELQKLEAEAANTGRFATPPPPPSSKTVQ